MIAQVPDTVKLNKLLLASAMNGDTHLIDSLLKEGANSKYQKKMHSTPLHYGAEEPSAM
ncbi:MAG: hypothetical protein IH946_07475 [Bacteroidetes bacterium]|nr:hypothetical protein [Bacteroidota bacterium]